MTTNKTYFINLLRDNGLSMRELAKRMGISHSQLSLTFSGSRRMQLDEAAYLSTTFGVPLSEVAENAGAQFAKATAVRVSVTGVMNGDGSVTMHKPDVIERTTAPQGLPENTKAIQARTAGTPLDWIDGWLFFYAEPVVSVGRLSLIFLSDGSATISNLYRGYTSGHTIRGFVTIEKAHVSESYPIILVRP